MNKLLEELDQLFKNEKWNQIIKKTKPIINSNNSIAPYYNLLGLSLSKLGRDIEAEHIFLQGIKKFDKEISLRSNIALIQINLNKLQSAEKNLIEAEKINNEDIYFLFALGLLKRSQLKFYDAIEIFKRICQKDVKFPRGLLILGQSYLDVAQQTNDKKLYEQAEKNFLLCSEIFPTNVEVDYTLSTFTDYSLNDFHQKKMLNKIKNLNLNNEKKVFIYFALGKSFEDQKKYDQSFEYIKLANDAKNTFVDREILKKEILKYRNVKKVFDNINFQKKNIEGLFQNKIIFVLGLPRSGTTLVHQLLSSANDTYGFGESIFLSKFFDTKIFDQNFLSRILSKKTIEDELIKVSNEIGNRYSSITEKKIFIDKMPPNFYWIGFIKLLFPNSKIIHITRNIKDNYLSIYKNLFGTPDMDWSYDEKNILRFILNYKEMMKYWKKFYEKQIYEIRYDDLVKNKIDQTKNLFNFCELKWDEKIFDFYKTAKTIRTVSINQVKKPIYQSSVNINEKFSKFLKHLNQLEDI